MNRPETQTACPRPASARARIPVALLRDLAGFVPATMPPVSFIDLAEYVASRGAEPDLIDSTEAAAIEDAEHALEATQPEQAGRVWSKDELLRTRAMLAEGKTSTAIAAALGRPLPATRTAIKRFRLRDPIAGPNAEPRTGRFGGGPAPDGAAKERVDAWREADHARLKELKASGASLSRMAEVLGRSAEACRQQLNLMRRAGEDVPSRHSSWTAAEDARLIAARKAGTTFPQIAAEMDRTVRSVEQRYRRIRIAAAPAAASAKPAVSPKPAAQQPIAPPAPPSADAAIRHAPPPAAAKVAAAIAPAPRRDLAAPILAAAVEANLSGRQMQVLRHLLTLPDSFTPQDDLYLAEGLTQRRQLAEMSDQLGADPIAITMRFRAMLFADITDRNGNVTIEGQADLLKTLRWRAGIGV